jgi:DNA repair exonuclease SbcCD nuclease subunit
MSLKILRVGDPHIRPANIAEAERLMEFILSIIQNGKIDRLEILGDLFHTHAIIRLEVLLFWNKWLEIFRDTVDTVVLVGNHDLSGDYNFEGHALTVFKRLENERLKIVDAPYRSGIFGYTPYRHGTADWLQDARQLASDGARILVCHTTFDGSQYDNGFYAPNGINPDDVPFDKIISGHIHKQQIIAGGKVDYPGTPKWDTASDANERKGVWLYEHDDSSGVVLQRDLISTEKVCTPIISLTWNEGEEQPIIPEGVKATIELIGSSDWIAKKKNSLKGKVGIKSKTTDQKRSAKRKAGNSLENYLMNLYHTEMDRQKLLDYAKELGIAA